MAQVGSGKRRLLSLSLKDRLFRNKGTRCLSGDYLQILSRSKIAAGQNKVAQVSPVFQEKPKRLLEYAQRFFLFRKNTRRFIAREQRKRWGLSSDPLKFLLS